MQGEAIPDPSTIGTGPSVQSGIAVRRGVLYQQRQQVQTPPLWVPKFRGRLNGILVKNRLP